MMTGDNLIEIQKQEQKPYQQILQQFSCSHVSVIGVQKADEGAVDGRLALVLHFREVVVHESQALLPPSCPAASHDHGGGWLVDDPPGRNELPTMFTE